MLRLAGPDPDVPGPCFVWPTLPACRSHFLGQASLSYLGPAVSTLPHPLSGRLAGHAAHAVQLFLWTRLGLPGQGYLGHAAWLSCMEPLSWRERNTLPCHPFSRGACVWRALFLGYCPDLPFLRAIWACPSRLSDPLVSTRMRLSCTFRSQYTPLPAASLLLSCCC